MRNLAIQLWFVQRVFRWNSGGWSMKINVKSQRTNSDITYVCFCLLYIIIRRVSTMISQAGCYKCIVDVQQRLSGSLCVKMTLKKKDRMTLTLSLLAATFVVC